MRDEIAEIIDDGASCNWCPLPPGEAELLADQIMALFTVPTIKLPCTECGGSGRIPDPHIDMLDPPLPTTSPCTCKEGEREWRVWWEVEVDLGAPIPDGSWAIGYDSKPLHATDLFDPDVAMAYGSFLPLLPYAKHSEINNNKGRLVLREVE